MPFRGVDNPQGPRIGPADASLPGQAWRYPAQPYQFLLGNPQYLPSSGTFRPGLLQNCDINNLPPDDGATCYMAAFPFLGRKRYGCGSDTYQDGYGKPYLRCEPVILKGEGFDFVSQPLRVAITAALAYFLLKG